MLLFVSLISFSFFSFSFYNLLGFDQEELPTVDIIIDKVISKTLSKLQQKQPLSMIGIGGEQKNGKEKAIDVSLALNKILNKEECRELVVECLELYLKDINDSVELKQYLYETPFTNKNLELRIFLTKPNGGDIVDPDICIISVVNGIISYRVQAANDKYTYTTTKESYEEALKIVQDKKIDSNKPPEP